MFYLSNGVPGKSSTRQPRHITIELRHTVSRVAPSESWRGGCVSSRRDGGARYCPVRRCCLERFGMWLALHETVVFPTPRFHILDSIILGSQKQTQSDQKPRACSSRGKQPNASSALAIWRYHPRRNRSMPTTERPRCCPIQSCQRQKPKQPTETHNDRAQAPRICDTNQPSVSRTNLRRS